MPTNERPLTLNDIFIEAHVEITSYSGRGMYGKACLAASLERDSSASAFWGGVLEDCLDNWEGDDLLKRLKIIGSAMYGTSSDQMGRGSILYWPGIPYVE